MAIELRMLSSRGDGGRKEHGESRGLLEKMFPSSFVAKEAERID
jgi:uncharacterized protein Veg